MDIEISDVEGIYQRTIKKIYGPYKRDDNRQHVVIHYGNDEKETKSYPKLIVELDLGRKLDSDETVHHKDHNKLNQNLDNLEVIDKKNHTSKHASEQTEEIVEIKCILCNTKTEKPARQIRNNKNQEKTGPFCSKSCAGLYGTMVQNNVDNLPKNQYHKYDV